MTAHGSGLRPALGLVLGGLTLAAAAGALLPGRGHLDDAVPALVLLLPVLVAGVFGGTGVALAVAAAAGLTVDAVFLRPYWTLRLDRGEDVAVVLVFGGVALTVGALSARQAERRQAAEARADELERLSNELRDVVAERQALAAEAARLAGIEAVDEQRAALLRSVSHDLRTPLATIRAVTSDLRSGTPYDDATRDELLDSVGDEAERLDRLVANLLSLSRIEAGAFKPDYQAVDVDELVHERVRRLARLFAQVRVVVQVPGDLPLVDGDYTQLDQVVTNLLENAARHAPPRTRVTITGGSEDGGRTVVLRVSDEGIGVPDHERARVFEPFRRGEGSRSSGIGLAICKAIVEAHGGAISVERTPGGGATFAVRLPARKAGHP